MESQAVTRLPLAAICVMLTAPAWGQTVWQGWLSSPSATVLPEPMTMCCVSLDSNGHTVTLNLDKGTVDLGGAKVDEAARAFWDAVRQVAGRSVSVSDPLGSEPLSVEDCRAQAVCSKGTTWVPVIIGNSATITEVIPPLNTKPGDCLVVTSTMALARVDCPKPINPKEHP